jgi:hypothetical protein
MRSPFFVARLAALTISLLLLGESIEHGWGVAPHWGWYLAFVLVTLVTAWDLVSLISCVIAFLLLVNAIDDGRAAFIALSIFTGAGLLWPRGRGRARAWTASSWWVDGTPWEGTWNWRWRR